jgi:glyoxylase-like metal-dependent hydrolase (beta-lactamase superfamily II)
MLWKLFFVGLLGAASGFGQGGNQPLVQETATKVSEHIWAIMGFPNVVIVVGTRATLVVDTGLGPRNGATVMRVVNKLGKRERLYLTTTHFHPEHAAGDAAFPENTILIRPAVQQQEMELHGQEMIATFSRMSTQNKELLADVKLRQPDIVFDNDTTVDLGGVTARLFWLGAAHTKGDELVLVQPDSALISGDIVEKNLAPNVPGVDGSPKGWLAILDKLEPLKPRYVLPDHGELGDGSLIGKERVFVGDLISRAQELKRQGVSAEDAGKQMVNEFKTKYPDYLNLNPVGSFVRKVYAEN